MAHTQSSRLSFPKDTLDTIERRYASIVLDRFSRYGEFWELFIGGRSDPTGKLHSVPYGLCLPTSMSKAEIQLFERSYEEIAMAHYTLFWKLVSARHQISNLKETLTITESSERFFKHFESFDVTYYHLSCCINQVYHLWGLLLEMMGKISRDSKGQLVCVKPAILSTFDKPISDLFKKLQGMEDKIDCYRDNIVHFAHGINVNIASGYYVPEKPERNRLWSEQSIDYVNNTVKRSEQDLEQLEQLLDEIHIQLISQLRNLFLQKEITVRY